MLSSMWQEVSSLGRGEGHEQSHVHCLVLIGLGTLDGSDWIRS